MPAPVRWPLAALSALVLVALSVPALAQSLDRPRFAEVLATSQIYADERTVIFYCLRQKPEMRSFLYFLVHADLEDAVKKIRAAGADNRQTGQLVETVWSNVRVAAHDARDTALDAKCAATDVEEEITLLRGVGRPLILRPAFRAL
jgi:predicted ATPase